MSNSFNVGDIMILKSGGPVMTVFSVGEESTACKYWNFAKSVFIEDTFLNEVIKKANVKISIAGLAIGLNKNL